MKIKNYIAWVLLFLLICGLGIAYGEKYIIIPSRIHALQSPTMPLVETLQPKTVIDAPSISKTITEPRVITKTIVVYDEKDAKTVLMLQAQVNTLTEQNRALQGQIDVLQQAIRTKSLVIQPKTRDQLIAIYRVNNPHPTCVALEGEDSRNTDNRCHQYDLDYQSAMYAWVDQQLANQ